ncbi:nuclear transport factor 2 family protein [uncultured Sphingomonas sp.]|uniref:nuclear transport factor 2 family protein n=1 Tax=uncultured Sphingomonas sp. TaxID=158754 RepID=UPI0035C9FC99
MPVKLNRVRPVQVAAALLIASSANAQDFADTQAMANKVLFSAQDAARDKRVAEQRRIEDLARRTDQQATLLQAQAASVQQLGDELQLIRDERVLIDLAAAFDATLVGRRWTLVRTFLADPIAIDLDGQPGAAGTMSADAFVASLPALTAGGSILPRSNQRVRIDGGSATLSSDGYAWRRANGSPTSRDLQAGQYEYRFERATDGWKIDGLTFHLLPATR